jgi:transposase
MTVSRIRKKTVPDIEKPKGGRPPILTSRDKKWLVRQVTSGKVDTATQLKGEFVDSANICVSERTVRRALKESGMKAVVKKKRSRLQPRHIKARYEFAVKYRHWTADDWKRVIWSDETKMNCLGSDGRKWVWKKPGGQLTDQHVSGTVKFGGGSLMLWGCMTAQGVGYACKIDGRMDAELYTRILNDELLGTIEFYGIDRSRMVFQQDNDPKHTSRFAREWFETNEIEVLDWPAQSPDLNPIEHLWWHLKRRLSGYDIDPSGIQELWERVQTEWDAIPAQVCIDLIETMPRRIDAMLKARGGYTKY